MNIENTEYKKLTEKVQELEEKLAKTQWLNEKENINGAESYIPFYGDITELNTGQTILDNVGKENLKILTSELMDLLDTSVAIYEINGDYAFGTFNSGWCQLLDASARKLCNTNDNKTALNCGKWLCHDDCWNNSAKAAIISKKATDIDCIGAIKLYAEPIFAGNEVVGVINIGYGNPPTDEKSLKELSEKFNIDFETLKQKAKAYKPRPDFIIEVSKKRLKSIARLIGEIISRKQAENRQKESERILMSILNESPFPIAVTDTNNEKVLYWSRSGKEMFGHSPKTVSEWYELAYPNAEYRKKVIEQWKPHLRKAQETKRTINIGEYEITCKNGSVKICELHIQFITDNLIITINEITERKHAEESLRLSEKHNAFLAQTAFELFELTSIQEIYKYTVQKLQELFEGNSIVVLVEYNHSENRWKMQHIEGIGKRAAELSKLLGFDFNQMEGEISTKYYEQITSGKVAELDFDFPGLFNNKLSAAVGNAVKKMFSVEKMYCIAYEQDEQIIGNITFITNKKTGPINTKLIEAFIHQVSTFIKKQKAEERLKKSEDKFRKFVENANEIIYQLTPEGVFTYVSPNCKEIFRIRQEEVVGRNLEKFVHPDDLHLCIDFLNKVSATGEKRSGLEYRVGHKNGSWRWHNSSGAPIIDESGKIVSYIGIARDITDRKKMLEELVAAKEKAQESDRLKSAFLANMSHEIRTPMNGILGFAELLKKPNLTGNEQQKYIRIIEKSGSRMLNIINDIIDISKIEVGLMKLDINETNINEQIEYIYTFFKPEVEAKGMKLMFKTTLSSQEAIIKTDREKVYAILTNLVKNAIKYSKEGKIEIGYKKKDEVLEFYVKDTGIGIPKDRQEAIFMRFIQADIADKMAHQGTGLGLSITRAYIEMLGGKIWVESEVEIGSNFYFTLPYIADPMNETVV